jgi:hypothetical protein
MKGTWRIPRAAVWLAAGLIVLGGLSCDLFSSYKGTAVMEHLYIVTQPQGGYGIDSLWCTFFGLALDTDTTIELGMPLSAPIKVTTVWHSSHGTYEREDFTWDLNGEAMTYTVAKKAPPRAHFDKPFWVEFYCEDAQDDHSFTSDTAICQ